MVSVAAINGAGAGEPVSVVEFTAEGSKFKQQQFKSYYYFCMHTGPLIHPRDIGSTRLNGTAVWVSWRPLSRSEARGFITNYTITYWRVGSNAANASTITVSGEDASSAIIINLDPNSDYYFTVSAGTVQGVGNVSVAMVIPIQSSGQRMCKHNYYVFKLCMLIMLFHSDGGRDCCRTDRCRGSTDNHTNNSMHCLHVSVCLFANPNY